MMSGLGCERATWILSFLIVYMYIVCVPDFHIYVNKKSSLSCLYVNIYCEMLTLEKQNIIL